MKRTKLDPEETVVCHMHFRDDTVVPIRMVTLIRCHPSC